MAQAISIKLPESQKARLQALAKERNSTISSLIREGIELILGDEKEPSCYDLVPYLFDSRDGIGESGLGDLSTNKDRLKNIGRKSSPPR
jgi:hypothetical protein